MQYIGVHHHNKYRLRFRLYLFFYVVLYSFQFYKNNNISNTVMRETQEWSICKIIWFLIIIKFILCGFIRFGSDFFIKKKNNKSQLNPTQFNLGLIGRGSSRWNNLNTFDILLINIVNISTFGVKTTKVSSRSAFLD